MANLIPVKRPDKNGHLVTRYVKGEQNIAGTGAPLPAPQLALTTPDNDLSSMSSFDYAEVVMARFRELDGRLSPSSIERVVQQLKSNSYHFSGAHEKLYSLLPKLDAKGVQSLSFGGQLGTFGINVPQQRVAIFATSVLGYDFARSVDNAIVDGTNERNIEPHRLLYRANALFGKDGKLRVSDEVVGDLESYYLLETLGINERFFNSTGDYYRGLTKLKAMQEDVTPYLPLLIAMHTAYEPGDRDYYFEDDYYLWENIDTVMQFPKERIHVIARETVRRGEYDQGLAEEIASSTGSDTLNDGLL